MTAARQAPPEPPKWHSSPGPVSSPPIPASRTSAARLWWSVPPTRSRTKRVLRTTSGGATLLGAIPCPNTGLTTGLGPLSQQSPVQVRTHPKMSGCLAGCCSYESVLNGSEPHGFALTYLPLEWSDTHTANTNVLALWCFHRDTLEPTATHVTVVTASNMVMGTSGSAPGSPGS